MPAKRKRFGGIIERGGRGVSSDADASAASTLEFRVVDEVTSPFAPEIMGTRDLVHYHQSSNQSLTNH